jgi:hypothetical protein
MSVCSYGQVFAPGLRDRDIRLMKTDSLALKTILGLELGLHPGMQLIDLRKILFQAAYGADHMLQWALRDRELFRASFTREWEHASRILPGDTPVVQIVDPVGRIARVHLSSAATAGLRPEPLLDVIMQQPWLRGDLERADAVLGQAASLGSPCLLPWSGAEILEAGIPLNPPSHSQEYGETHYRLVNDWEALGLRLPGGAVRLVLPDMR